MQKICIIYGKPFEGCSVKKTCSPECAKRRKKENKSHEITTKKVIRKFYCRKCGKLVKIQSQTDKRKVFCSTHCERQYWKHPHPELKYERKEVTL